MHENENLRAMMLMNVAMLTFTLNDTCMKLLTMEVPLYQAIALRGIITTAVLVALARVSGAKILLRGRDAMGVGLRSIAEIGATVTFLTALIHMPIANISAILQSLPLAVTLGAALMFGEPLGWKRLSAILIGFIGVLLIVQPGAEGFDVWSLLALISVAFVVVRDLSTRRIGLSVPSVTVAIWAGGSVTLVGVAGTILTGWQPMTGIEVGLTFGAAINLIVGYLTVVMAMRVGHIGFVAPFRYTALIWAILMGWLIFGTLPDGLTVLGAAIVVATGLFTLFRERQLRRAPQT